MPLFIIIFYPFMKYIAIGSLVGIALGIIATFLFPALLLHESVFNIELRNNLGFSSDYYSPKAGSPFAVGSLFPVVFGILGGLLGAIYLIIKNKLFNEVELLRFRGRVASTPQPLLPF